MSSTTKKKAKPPRKTPPRAVATREETAKPAVTNTREDADRTDDPVRMYLREMGSVELLSREGEIAIAKRIEAGRDAMIRGLCESPLTFEAIMVWRDELREQKILLRDIIDLEATYGAEMGIVPQSAPGVNADGLVDPEAAKIADRREPPRKPPSRAAAADEDEDEDESRPKPPPKPTPTATASSTTKPAISMSAMEAELKEGVMATLDAIAEAFGQFRKLQEKRIDLRLQGQVAARRARRKPTTTAQNTIIEELKKLKLNNARIESLVEQLYAINRKLIQLEGKLMRLAESNGVPRLQFLEAYHGSELDPKWTEKVAVKVARPGRKFVAAEADDIADIRARNRRAGARNRRADRRISPHRPRRAKGRTRSAPGQEGNGRSEPAPRHLHRQEIHQSRPAIPGSDPGRQYRPDEGGR